MSAKGSSSSVNPGILNLMSAAETAAYLGWTEQELNYWALQGRGPTRRFMNGAPVCVRWDVERWAENFLPVRAAHNEFPVLAELELDVSEFDQPIDVWPAA